MKKFGFNKRGGGSEAPEDDANRSALFGSRKAKAAAPGQNPYAQSGGNPYAQQDSSGGGGYGAMGQPPPPYQGGGLSDRQRQEKTPVPVGGYGGGDRYGNSGNYGQSGYGADRYGGGSSSSSRRPGGYGGMGNDDNDAGRNALFGNAAERYQQQKPSGLPSGPRPGGGGYGGGGRYGDDGSGYGASQDRQLTEEEQEEEDVAAMKQQMRQMKQEDVSSTRNALRVAAQAEQSGMDTLNRLGAQGERIHNTERHLDLAENQNKIASDKTRELKTLNKSMFAVHVSNPFTANSRRAARDQAITDNHEKEREQREATRQAAFNQKARQAEYQRDLHGNQQAPGPRKKDLAERSKYQFEADSEDEDMENEIDDNLDQLHGAAGRLNNLARAMGREVDVQNQDISRITNKTDNVDGQITMNRAKLDRIH